MNHNNHGLVVDLGGKWRIYTNTLPPGNRALGTITRDGYDTGALVLILATGRYVQSNAGVIRSLDQRKVVAALADARTGHGGPGRGGGRKTADGVGTVERKNVTLDAESIETLRAYGDGDLSLGIRSAARLVKSNAWPSNP